jgi:hypothetical protein
LRNEPLANADWSNVLDVLALGDMSAAAFQRYERRAMEGGVAWHNWAWRIRSSVKRHLIIRGVWL